MRECRPTPIFSSPGLEFLEARDVPTAGLLDPTFGTGGLVVSPAGQIAVTVAGQPDGKVLVGGDTQPGPTSANGLGSPAVFRFNADGSLDTGFGNNGVFSPPVAAGTSGAVDNLLVEPDGKIIVSDYTEESFDNFTSALLGLTSNGHLDPTFGVGGLAPEQVGATSFRIASIALEDNGTLAAIVVPNGPMGQPEPDEVMHYTADGQPDTTLGNGGLVTLQSPNSQALLAAAEALPDGKVVTISSEPVAGLGGNDAYVSLLISRFNANGSPDKTFNGTGSAIVNTPSGLFQDPADYGEVAVQPDGKLLLTDSSDGAFAALRFNADGTLDRKFGTNGFATVQVGAPDTIEAGPSLAVQPDGKLLLAGTDEGPSIGLAEGPQPSTAFALVRLTADGAPDPSFGAGGVVVTTFPSAAGAPAFAADLALLPNEAIVVGTTEAAGGAALALALYRTSAANIPGATTVSHTVLTETPSNDTTPGTLTATVTAAGGQPTGSVTFLNGARILGAAPVGAAGMATISLPELSPGTYHLTAKYSGDGNDQASSATSAYLVPKATAPVSVSVSAGTVAAGEPVTLTATISGPFNLPQPTGTVVFLDGNNFLGTAPVNALPLSPIPTAGPQATLTLTNLTPGAHTIRAEYSGDADFVSATSGGVPLKVLGTSTITLSAPPPSGYGQPVTLTAKVTETGAAHPSGTVVFLEGKNFLGIASVGSNGQARLTTTQLSVGTHAITAGYLGDATDVGSAVTTKVTVVKAITQVTSSVSATAIVYGQPIKLNASIGSSVPGEVLNKGTLTFAEGTHVLGVVPVTKGAGALPVKGLAPGKHTITTSYSGDANHQPSSATIAVTVLAAQTTTRLQLPANAFAGQRLTLSAAVAELAPSTLLPVGQVTFRDNGALLGKVTVGTNGTATLVLPRGLITGKHRITAQFDGGAQFAVSQDQGSITVS